MSNDAILRRVCKRLIAGFLNVFRAARTRTLVHLIRTEVAKTTVTYRISRDGAAEYAGN